MTKEQMNIAIAKAVNWKPRKPLSQESECPPFYCDDLNAMAEIESGADYKYWMKLHDLTHAANMPMNHNLHFDCLQRIASATAHQRAEAFLRTKGLYVE